MHPETIFGKIWPMEIAAKNLRKITDNTREVDQLREEVEVLKHQLDWFRRQLFGEKSEKRMLVDNPNQGTLFGAEVTDSEDVPEPKQTISYQRGKAKKDRGNSVNDSGLRFDDSVPVEQLRIEPAELHGPDADQYEIIGEKVTHRLAQHPASYVVLAYTEVIIKKKTTQQIIPATTASAVFDKSIVDVSFLAGMLVDKFTYHCPLYRQHQKLQQSGFKLSRSSLTNWTSRSISLLEPIYDAQLENILRSKVLAMDETPVKAGRKEKGKMNKAYFWPLYGEANEVAFTFSLSRKKQHVVDTLKKFNGTLLTDGYAAYERYAAQSDNVIHAQCWIHTRRYFEQALKAEPTACEQALAIIGQLYAYEKSMR